MTAPTIFPNYDVIVAGGGPSGIAAAVSAARLGARTLIVERYGRLGGAAVVNMVGPLMGSVNCRFVNEVLERFDAIGGNWELIDMVYADLLNEAGADILLHSWVVGPIMRDGVVSGLSLLTKQGYVTIDSNVVVDATADGDVAFGAGAAFEKGRDGDGLLQPMSIMYRLGGVDKSVAIENAKSGLHVDDRVYADLIARAHRSGDLPCDVGVIRLYECALPGQRIVNATQINRVDGTSVLDLTRAEIEGRKQAISVVRFLNRHVPGYENAYIDQMPLSIGVRETRRFIGLEYLTREDLIAGRKRPDAVVRDASFPIDIHNPVGSGPLPGSDEPVQPYDIPYGCLVPHEVDGLLLAGRCISGSHEAHASYRVQCIAMATGVAAGSAAALSCSLNVPPRAVPIEAIQQALNL